MQNKNVAILGASAKSERYSHRAQKKLLKHGYNVFLVARKAGDILGVPAVADLADIDAQIDTVTVYLQPRISANLIEKIIALQPRRVIFNPGTESTELAEKLRAANIVVTEACTLVLLRAGQFESS